MLRRTAWNYCIYRANGPYLTPIHYIEWLLAESSVKVIRVFDVNLRVNIWAYMGLAHEMLKNLLKLSLIACVTKC